MEYTFDFFNYAGIHRPVQLYSIPKHIHIQDVTIVTKSISEDHDSATIKYDFQYTTSSRLQKVTIKSLKCH
jgi:beta-glucuronidase